MLIYPFKITGLIFGKKICKKGCRYFVRYGKMVLHLGLGAYDAGNFIITNTVPLAGSFLREVY